ncbi:hypothetical protein L6164_000100 [Bauhinia variegata]|uniref:Uncharacterized protein n=1 Tax=Bauhinia variegata TaxID=167791 RepID=A0ACB9Q5E8_BAUVA|nr:hypothetical protein L6164_000100 [Bauhinia variegata]
MLKRPSSYFFFFRTRRAVTSCTLPADPPSMAVSNVSGDHKSLCFSLAEHLIQRGIFQSAQQVIRRMIRDSSSVSDAIWVVNFADERGLELDLGSYSAFIRKLVKSGEPQLAEMFYSNKIIARGVSPDPAILNSMIICFCKLGKLEAAMTHFDKLLFLNWLPCQEACISLLREFCSKNQFLDAFDYFIKGINAGGQFSFWCYNLLISGLCHGGHLDEALQVFDILRNSNHSLPTVHIYKSLFYGLCKRGRVVEAESLFGEMESQGMYVDKTMYTFLVHEYCKDKKMKMALRVFLRMLKTGCEPDNHLCNTLIHGFMKMNQFDKGWVIHNKMMEWGIKPNVATYHIMINKYCREDKVDCALILLEHMIRSNLVPNVHCYTVLISALYKQNRIREADELYKTMVERGVVPDHVLFLVLMKKCPKGCVLHLALSTLVAIAKNGCGYDLSMFSSSSSTNPSHLEKEIELLLEKIARSNLNLATVAYGIFVSALCEEGQIDEALVCLDKMVDLGFKPSLSTFNSVIKCLCQLGIFEDSHSLINLIEDHGMVPNQATYLIMINELCNRGDLVSVNSILDEMKERGTKPSVAIYDSIIGCLCKERRIFEAEDMFKRMLQTGVDPDEIIYTTLINGYGTNGRAVKARELFDKMIENSIKPSSHSYTALISGLVKRHMIDMGCTYLGRMLGDGTPPNIVLYTSLIKHFLQNGEFGFAFRLVDSMEKNEMECDLIMCIILASGVCRHISGTWKKNNSISYRNSDRAKEMLLYFLYQKPFLPKETSLRVSSLSPAEMTSLAMKLIEKIKGVKFMPNLYLYNCIISGFCRAQRFHDAYNIWKLMQKEGVHPNQVSYTILIDGHVRSGDIDSAVRLFNTTNAEGCVPDRIAHNTLLKGLLIAGRLLDAMSLVYAMHKRGLYPNRVNYNILLNCFCSNDLSDYAYRVFEEMIAQNYKVSRYNHNWLLYFLCESNRLHEARLVLDMLLLRGAPDSKDPDESWLIICLNDTTSHSKILCSIHKIAAFVSGLASWVSRKTFGSSQYESASSGVFSSFFKRLKEKHHLIWVRSLIENLQQLSVHST